MAERKKIAFSSTGNALRSSLEDHILGVADDIFDENLQKYQSEINTLASSAAFDVTTYTSGTTYSGLTEALEEVPDNFRTPGMNIKFVVTGTNEYALFTYKADEVTTEKFSNPDNWTPSLYVEEDDETGVIPDFDPVTDTLHVTSGQSLSNQEKLNALENIGLIDGGIEFNVSEYYAVNGVPKSYSGLTDALSDVPQAYRKGGMSVKYVHTSDNKYVQYRYMGTAVTGNPNPFIDTANWQGVDDEPIAGSDNLVKSGGVSDKIKDVSNFIVDKHTVIGFTRPLFVNSQNRYATEEGDKAFIIPVVENDIVVLKSISNSLTYNYYVLASTYPIINEQVNFMTGMSARQKYTDETFTVPENGYLIVCHAHKTNVDCCKSIIINNQEILFDGLQKQITDLSDVVEEQGDSIESLASDIEDIQGEISVNRVLADWGGVLVDCESTSSVDTVYYNKVASGTKPTHITKIIYKVSAATPIKLYKVTESGTTATAVEIASIVNNAAGTYTYDYETDLAADEYIGISAGVKYAANAEGYKYAYIKQDGDYKETNNAMLGIRLMNDEQIFLSDVVTEIDNINHTVNKPNEIIVDIHGHGDYTNPFDAIVATLGHDTAANPITIKILPGTYIMPTLPRGNYTTYCQNRYLALVGTDKVNCILRNDKGYYNGSSITEGNLGDNSPLKISGNIYIANLTIISTDTENSSEADDVYHRSYCIHMDATASKGSTMEVHNCHLINNHAPCIGFGIPKQVTLKITDCELEADLYDPTKTHSVAVIYGHDRGGSDSVVEEHLIIKNTIFSSSNAHAVETYNNEGALMDCSFIDCVCDLPVDKGVVLDTGTSLTKLCYGNNISDMNYSM